MSPYPTRFAIILILIILLAASSASLADAPPDNSIPIMGLMFYPWRWSPDLLCELSWMHFDGIEFEVSILNESDVEDLMAYVDSCGMLVILNPADLNKFRSMGNDSCRGHYLALSGDSAFIQVDEDGSYIDSLHLASATETLIVAICDSLVSTFDKYDDQIWFYRYFDEPASTQRARQYNTQYAYDDYFPSYLADDSTFRADSAGTYSWIKWALEQADSTLITCGVFAGAQRIDSLGNWAYFFHDPGTPDAHDRADMVRGFCNMRYQPIGARVSNNFNDHISIDIYPFRHVGTVYQEDEQYTPALGDSLNTWLLNHMEEAMDSTFLAAVENDCELLYWPQAFGRAGGALMWEYDNQEDEWNIDYISYSVYRIPSPAELRMCINLAFLRQVKGLMPFCISTYFVDAGPNQPDFYTIGLLDNDMIPFDAPFEEWAYTGRPQDSLSYIRPDSIEPFIDGFDPLADSLPDAPSGGSQKQRESFLEWKFEPFGRLWNSLADIFGAITFMAPELAELWWYDGYEDAVTITLADPPGYITPEIKVFRNTVTNTSYLFYVNRNCRDSTDIVSIRIDIDSLYFPPGPALDHSRRVIIPSASLDSELFTYYDTLEAGAARLVELTGDVTYADLRITSTDVFAREQSVMEYVRDFVFTAGDSINVYAEVFNLGTIPVQDVLVILSDITGGISDEIGRDTLDFGGLSHSGYTTDSDTASFALTPGAIGIRKFNISVAHVSQEPDTRDNSVTIPFLILPRDYSTEELGDPWDMNEATTRPIPDWNTDDIEAIAFDWESTAWTDSVSGMFEGALDESAVTDTLRGNISLSIPSADSMWIDTDKYYMLSFAGTWFSPYDVYNNECTTYVGWMDSTDASVEWHNITNYLNCIRNGWDLYHSSGYLDLRILGDRDTWSDCSVQEFWLSFRRVNPPGNLGDFPIRLGWVKLTE